ncbi:MAG: hypothetical protein QM756_12470 [Polyangiaceae bacterium]
MKRALCAFLLLCAACSGPARPPLPPAPELTEPALALPADLDLVLRFDLQRLRSALGIDAEALLRRVSERTPSSEPDADTARLLLSLLSRTETLWLAVRPGLSAELTDGVIALRGDFPRSPA